MAIPSIATATRAAVGTSALEDSHLAGQQAATEALAGLDGRAPTLAIVFSSADHEHAALLAGIHAVVSDIALVGCSGEGVIAGNRSEEAFTTVAVMLVASTRVRFETLLVEGYGADPAAAGAELAALINAGPADARCLCVLPDGLQGNCTAMLVALKSGLSRDIPVVGGAAADAMTFTGTFQYVGDRVVSGGLAALLICGDVDVEVAVSHGCSPIGLERQVTRAEDGWIQEIDGQPAWGVFKEYLNDDCEDLNAEGIVHLCLGEKLRHGGTDYDPLVIRTPLQLNKASGALFFPGGGLTEGSAVQMTRRDPDKIRRSAQQCAESVSASHHGRSPDLVLQFDCAGRGQILWGSCAAAEIVEPLRRTLGGTTPWLGFHTYGEIAPIDGRPYYHNYTVALCALYEREQ